MLETTAALGQAILSGVWSLFGVYVPGFDFTFGQMWLAVALASISILVIKFRLQRRLQELRSQNRLHQPPQNLQGTEA